MNQTIKQLLSLFTLMITPLHGVDSTTNQLKLSVIVNIAEPDQKIIDGHIFYLQETGNAEDETLLSTIEATLVPAVRSMLKQQDFTGKKEQTAVIPTNTNDKPQYLIFVGVGKLNKSFDVERETLRRTAAYTIPLIKQYHLSNVIVNIPTYLESACNATKSMLIQQMALAHYLAVYTGNHYQTKDLLDQSVTLHIITEENNSNEIQSILNAAQIIAEAMNEARFLTDSPPNLVTPTAVSVRAQNIAEQLGNLTCTIIDEEQAAAMGMGAFSAVSQGSEQPGKIVILEYMSSAPSAPTIVLCGKGITFDTGGVNVKPSKYMTGMKRDMAGAAAVIAVMRIIAQLQPACNVIGITPLAEHMLDGRACRQDDIVIALNGTSIEINHTDAEGRLILADALSYAGIAYNPDIVIDIATLTGACVTALGHYHTGLFTRNDALATQLINAGNDTGDRVWRLPLTEDHATGNKSTIADLSNDPQESHGADATYAAAFLEHFAPEKAQWAHLDIAGTVDSVPDAGYVGKSATGAGIRLLVDFIMSM